MVFVVLGTREPQPDACERVALCLVVVVLESAVRGPRVPLGDDAHRELTQMEDVGQLRVLLVRADGLHLARPGGEQTATRFLLLVAVLELDEAVDALELDRLLAPRGE